VGSSSGSAVISRPGPTRTSRLGWTAIAAVLTGYLVLVLASGAPGSPLVPVLPAGVRPGEWIVRGAGWLGLSDLTRTQLTVLALVVVALVLAAFALLLFEARRGRVRLWAIVAATLVALALAVAAPVLLSRDVYSYAAYGRILSVHDSNPYLRPPSAFPADPFVRAASPEWIDTPSVYGPGFTLLSAGIGREWAGSPTATVLAFKVVAGLSVAGAALFAAMASRAIRHERDAGATAALAAAVVGLNPVLVLHTVGGGHNDALIAVLLSGGFVLALGPSGSSWDHAPGDVHSPRTVDGRALAVTSLLTLAVLVKAVVVPVTVLWWWQVARGKPPSIRWRSVGIHVILAAALTVALFIPVQAGWSSVRALLSVTSRQGWASGPGLVARGGRALGRAIGGSGLGSALEAVATVAFVALFLALFWRLLTRAGPRPLADAWGGTMLLLAMAAPYLLPWYAAWFVPFLGLMGDRRLALAGLAASGLLALTGVPAEAGTTSHVWRYMLLAVHYAAAPIMLALLGVVAVRILRLTRA
jgi:alpha-1,6-mannosyltransferase